MSDFRTVARLSDVPENSLHAVEVDGTQVVLINASGRLHALHDQCSHEEFPLSSGELTGDEVTCILHGARFDLETGAPRALPAVKPVRTFECRVEDGEIRIRLD